jgi:catechol 2,3-dioxygenase-like lactoylglutathione lyase family enzyme
MHLQPGDLNMPRELVDYEGLASEEVQSLMRVKTPGDLPFNINKIGHVLLKVQDLAHSVAFYTQILGFKVSDVYPDSMSKGGIAFMRCNSDHHGLGLVGAAPGKSQAHELHHIAFEVSTLDEVLRAAKHLRKNNVNVVFEGRRRAGSQVSVEFLDPDGHTLELFWAMDQVGADGRVRPPEEWRQEGSFAGAIANAPPGQDTRLQDPSLLDSASND